MLTKLGKTYRRLRRGLSRSHLLSRWLGYGVAKSESHKPGLIILQLDGLSRQQFEAAIEKKRLPFLKELIERRYFHRLSFYSGIPSTTPAVQAEVMYGVKGAVPAFQFLHRKSGKVFRMYDHDAVKTVVEEFLDDAKPLLESGASYSNIYSGGAKEARCCFETTDVPRVLEALNPLRLMSIFFLYFFTLLRIALLTGVEVIIGLADMIQGIFARREWISEIKFVPARVLVSIVLREWVRIAVKLSVAQGTIVIYANLLGYDEQSHRRGPSSAFAHWGLKGIDKTIEDIFKTAKLSDARDYEVVVFSDHGQEETRIYEFETGQTIQNAVADALRDGPLGHHMVRSLDPTNGEKHLDQRMRQLMKIKRGRTEAPKITESELAEQVIVTAQGPIGHVYFPVLVPDEAKATCAEDLVTRGQVPLVVYRTDDGKVLARNARGLWILPDDIQQVCGDSHPFAHEVADDLAALTENENSGDVVICGWDPKLPPLTFVRENGAHGSIGAQETRGFALLPTMMKHHARTTFAGEKYIRGVDLYDGAGRFLKKWESDEAQLKHDANRSAKDRHVVAAKNELDGQKEFSLRVMTYNTHHCIGMDGKCRPLRIANVISSVDADIIALQEMDVNRQRSGSQDQTAFIAAHLGMSHCFFPVWLSDAEQYGLSIISRFPMSVVQQKVLTDFDHRDKREARGAIWVSIETNAGRVHVLNTHLGLTQKERSKQVDELLSERWLSDLPKKEPVIFAGDLNAGPTSQTMKRLTKLMHCAQTLAEDHQPQKTFASVMPMRRIDHILVSHHFRVERVNVPKTHTAVVASDHLPVCAELVLFGDDCSHPKTMRVAGNLLSGGLTSGEVVTNGRS
ncbi:endonuclease/exonuclease/phosphatase family protein [Rubripirellula reticaptiva]|uniref:Phospholipase C n=1 Tax=Rubripirellula reticaptiva TaxID=2528013 RepID=A0A5C6EDY2_9BACT|nr:endonuclease/exonuclease/phosphatase family protein [Rubripirellula reticaptiva]TWU46860.1 Phospholipase C precursor [Rubripirellula reticaptiva]